MIDEAEVEKPECEQCGKAGEELHTCPYLVEMEGDRISLCTCCYDCAEKCADDAGIEK